MRKRVLDLNAGLGGRIYAFKKAGFEIVAAIDNDVENCEIMTSWIGENKIVNCNLLEVAPDALPDADIITAKYIQHLSYESGRMRYDIPKNENIAIFDIIKKKEPILFLLEVPVSSITSKRQNLEDYMQRFYEIGYSVSYVIYDEMSFSGYSMEGRQGYIIGCRDGENSGFSFPKPLYISPERKLTYEDPEYIYPWYRKLNFSTNEWERGYVYLRTRGAFEKNNIFTWVICERIISLIKLVQEGLHTMNLQRLKGFINIIIISEVIRAECITRLHMRLMFMW